MYQLLFALLSNSDVDITHIVKNDEKSAHQICQPQN